MAFLAFIYESLINNNIVKTAKRNEVASLAETLLNIAKYVASYLSYSYVTAVIGDRDKCLQMISADESVQTTTPTPSGNSEQVAIIILSICCGILIAMVIAVAMYCHRKNKKLSMTSNLGK